MKIAIIEDDAEVREKLAELIRKKIPSGVVQEYPDAESVIECIRDFDVNIALVDINLPGMDGISLIRQIKSKNTSAQCIVLTIYDQPEVVFEAIKSGATGYLLKSTPAAKIIESIQEVHAGGSPISSRIARKIIEAFAEKLNPSNSISLLSRREREILEQLGKGLMYQEIADLFFISLDTVRTHVRNIYEKLQVNSRDEALRKTGMA
ncbi:MAG: response regulator [Bacteroidota bacterium]